IEGIPFRMPERSWAKPPALPLPPPAGKEASYEWYVKQFPDPVVWTPIGPPGDPAEAAVTRNGQLMGYAPYYVDRCIYGTDYHLNALVFALNDNPTGTSSIASCKDHPGQAIAPMGCRWKPRVEQSVDPSNPSIIISTWKYDNIQVRETTFAEPFNGKPYETGIESTLAWAVFDLTNTGSKPETLTWLASLIGDNDKPVPENISYRDGALFENDNAVVAVPVIPPGFELKFVPRFFVDDDSSNDIHRGLMNALTVTGTIEPSQTVRIVFNRVLHFPDAEHWKGQPVKATADDLKSRSFEAGLELSNKLWAPIASKPLPFKTPDEKLDRIIAKAIADGHVLTKRWNGQYIVFDSSVYRCQWDDASTKWFYALDLMGHHETCDRLLETVLKRQGQRKPKGMQTREGCFTDVTNTSEDGSNASWASCNGWALWAMAEHARLTGDKAWLEKYKKQLIAGCDWIVRERQFSKQPPNNPCAGLLRGKFVCDLADSGDPATSGVGFFVYTDAISYVGLNEVAHLLDEIGDPEGQRLIKEAEEYRKDIIAAVDRLTDRSRDPWYLPWTMHTALEQWKNRTQEPWYLPWDQKTPPHFSQYFYDVCGPINLAFSCGDGGVLSARDERIDHVIRWMIDSMHQGSVEHAAVGFVAPTLNDGATFYAQDLALALLERGQVEEFLRIFYALTAAGITHDTLTTTEWGPNTMPHIHSIGSLVRMYRSMMVREERKPNDLNDDVLHLLQGVPRRWFAQGQQIRITNAPTWYGPVSLESNSDIENGKITMKVQFSPKSNKSFVEAFVNVHLRLPNPYVVESVTNNGEKCLWRFDEETNTAVLEINTDTEKTHDIVVSVKRK
ncbi:MAG: hypothetical protein FWC56_05400, partial [Phycisphaerae bacterium]|nr:hypothetical protein [Phycisphaerae bacterium]